jgi:hypothetical protein
MEQRIPLDEQITEVEHELTRRRQEYGHLVERGRLPAELANARVDRMLAVLRTLEWLRRNAQWIRGLGPR